MKFIVIELQTNADGTVGNLVYSYDTENEAWSKFHSVLASASISTLPSHCCVLLTSEGALLGNECFHH